LSELPPPIREHEFRAVNTVNEDEIKAEFIPLVRKLHLFLNQASCVQDLQKERRNWKTRVGGQPDVAGKTFTDSGTDECH